LAHEGRRDRVLRHSRMGARRPAATDQLACHRAPRRAVGERAAPGAQHRRRALPRHVHRRATRRTRDARSHGPRGDVARAPLSAAKGSRGPRQLRRLSLVAAAGVGNPAALSHRRLAPADGHRPQLRGARRRRAAAAVASAEGARARADAAARPAHAARAARSPRARLRPRRRRGVARAVRRRGRRRARALLVPLVAAFARGDASALPGGGDPCRRMARRCPAERSARGGGGIQAIRKARARIALATLSSALYASVLAYVLARSDRATPATGALGAAGALLLLVALVRAHAAVVPWTLGLLATAYGIALVVRGRHLDEAAPLVAVGLLLCGELASWSIDERLAIPAEAAVWRARALALGALALGSLVVASLAVALSAAPAGAGLAWTVLGAASAVAVVAAAVLLARRPG